MNGGQDLGGMMGFGPIVPEPEGAPYFHTDWERRALALVIGAGALGEWNLDMMRHARETLHPVEYLSSSYYEVWFKALEKLLVAGGLATAEEVAAGRSLHPPKPVKAPLGSDAVASMLARGSPYDRAPNAPARFAVGDAVRTRNINTTGHNRLPRYAHGRRGAIGRVHGVFVLPDANASGRGPSPEWLYSVRFSGAELWGESSDGAVEVALDAWESYLEPDVE